VVLPISGDNDAQHIEDALATFEPAFVTSHLPPSPAQLALPSRLSTCCNTCISLRR
jgi:hypothetical protein